MTNSNSFEDQASASRFRDIVTRIAESVVTRMRPPATMGQVVSIDKIERRAEVIIPPATESVTVRMGAIQPGWPGQWVRIESKAGNKYITDTVGPVYAEGPSHFHPDTGWIPLILGTGWTYNDVVFAYPSYRIINGIVYLRGIVRCITARLTGAIVFILPEEARPTSTSAESDTAKRTAFYRGSNRIDLWDENGEAKFTVAVAVGEFLILDGIVYPVG